MNENENALKERRNGMSRYEEQRKMMEENRKKIHELIDSITHPGMLEYFETFIRLILEKYGGTEKWR